MYDNWMGAVVLETGLVPRDALVVSLGIAEYLRLNGLRGAALLDEESEGAYNCIIQEAEFVTVFERFENRRMASIALSEYQNILAEWTKRVVKRGIQVASTDRANSNNDDYLALGEPLLGPSSHR